MSVPATTKSASAKAGLTAVVATALCISWAVGRGHAQDNTRSDDLGFPYEVLGETQLQSLSTTVRRTWVFLPRTSYFPENLDKLFRYYSKKFPNKSEMVDVYVYTDKSGFDPNWDGRTGLTPQFGLPQEASGPRLDALFVRDVFRRDHGHVNEQYHYRPSLDELDRDRTVVLKGRPRSGTDRILQSWKARRGTWVIEVTKYQTEGVRPQGYYYTFESDDPVRPFPSEHELMTFRQDEPVPIPSAQVVFVTDRVAYVFMGYMLAVTADAGHTCAVWDAETDLPDRDCCKPGFIERVRIDPDGNGTMIFRPGSERARRKLQTRDYGRNWTQGGTTGIR